MSVDVERAVVVAEIVQLLRLRFVEQKFRGHQSAEVVWCKQNKPLQHLHFSFCNSRRLDFNSSLPDENFDWMNSFMTSFSMISTMALAFLLIRGCHDAATCSITATHMQSGAKPRLLPALQSLLYCVSERVLRTLTVSNMFLDCLRTCEIGWFAGLVL